ncbi:hypothetical protein [Kribbella monticola]|uniref:hypothetical protein n=1 Tax=Kribbella monticola TaxID=2185285 RepID=UPI000DD49E26|nr:hypothetical protein [Kribbella monticola]
MSTPHQTPDEFAQIGSDDEVNEALKPKKTVNLPAATAVLAGVVVLAIGLAGGAGLHAAFAKDNTTTPQAGARRGAGGYGGFRGQGQGTGQPGTGGPGGNAAIGTVVSANSSQLVVKTQNGDVTVKLTGDTAIDITSKGTAADLKAGEQVVVSGETSNGTLTARTVRQGGTGFGPFGRNPSPSPSN